MDYNKKYIKYKKKYLLEKFSIIGGGEKFYFTIRKFMQEFPEQDFYKFFPEVMLDDLKIYSIKNNKKIFDYTSFLKIYGYRFLSNIKISDNQDVEFRITCILLPLNVSIIISYLDGKLDSKKFIDSIKDIFSDEYNEYKIDVKIKEASNKNIKFIYLSIDRKYAIQAINQFKEKLIVSTDNNVEQEFIFGKVQIKSIADFKKSIKEFLLISELKKDYEDNMFKEKLDHLMNNSKFDELYTDILNINKSSGKGLFLEYGTKLFNEQNYEQAIRFLNSEDPNNKEHLQAQYILYRSIGEVINLVDKSEKRELLNNKIKVAYKLKDTYNDVKDVIDLLLFEYAGYRIDDRPSFKLSECTSSDALDISLKMADELYKKNIHV